jgi:hypothetical protein
VVSSPLVSPPRPYTPPSPHPYAPHAHPISFFSILSPAQYWVSSSDHLAPRYAMTPILSFQISSRSKKNEPRYVCLSEVKSSHSYIMWTEVSPSLPIFLQMGLLLNPIIYKCLLTVLSPVRRPITALDCVLLMDNNRPL